jgi:hypothetical protein
MKNIGVFGLIHTLSSGEGGFFIKLETWMQLDLLAAFPTAGLRPAVLSPE